MPRFLRPAGPHISVSILDGELVAIDLASGSYYHAGVVGAQIWELASTQVEAQDIATRLADRYPGVDQVIDHVGAFLDQLIESGLVSEHETPGPVDGPPSQPAEPPAGSGAYEPPNLGRFDDMQQLLLLDPIHDVDQSGWPVSHENAPTADTTKVAAKGSSSGAS